MKRTKIDPIPRSARIINAPSKTCVHLKDGTYFDYDLFDKGEAELPDIRTIAWNLAHQTRFIGSLNRPISIAAHSMRVSARAGALAYAAGCSPSQLFTVRACGLVHDAHEAVFCDLPSPLKTMFRQKGFTWYDEIRAKFDEALAKGYGINLTDELKTHVIAADIDMLHYEMDEGMRGLGTTESTDFPSSASHPTDPRIQDFIAFMEAAQLYGLADAPLQGLHDGLEYTRSWG